ncbi:hypothetical protein ACFX2I_024977 [Malus domestica]
MAVSSGVSSSSQTIAMRSVRQLLLNSGSTCSPATPLRQAHSLTTSSLICGEKPPLQRAASLTASTPLQRSHSFVASSSSAVNNTPVSEQPPL